MKVSQNLCEHSTLEPIEMKWDTEKNFMHTGLI